MLLRNISSSPVPFWGRSSVRIALMFYVVLIPLLAIDIFFTVERRQDDVNEVYADLELLSGVVAAQQTAYVAAGRDLLLALGQIEEVRSGGSESCSEILRRVSRQYDRYTVFTRVDTEGFIECSSAPLTRRINVLYSENIRNALTNNEFSLSRFIIGPISGKPVLVFSSPMIMDDEVIGLVNTGLSLGWLDGLLDTLAMPSNVYLTMFDGDGTVLAQHPTTGYQVGDNMKDLARIRTVLESGGSGQGEVTQDGKTVYFSYTEVQNIPGHLYIMAYTPASAISSRLNQNTALHLVGVLSVLLFSLILARIMTRRIFLDGMTALSGHAERIARGMLDSRTGYPHNNTDIGRLAETYDRMAEHIQADNRELSYRNQLLTAQQEASSEGILVVDNSGQVRLFNKQFARMWNLPENIENTTGEALLGDVMHLVKHPNRFSERIHYLYDHLDEESANEEIELIDGRVFERYSKGMVDDDGIYWGRIWFYRDITEQKRAQRTIKEFIATASHELRTPLTAIRGALGLLVGGVGGEMTEQGKQLVGVAASNTDRLIALVNDILDIEKIEQGKIDLTIEDLPLGGLIAESLQANRPYADRFNVSLETVGSAQGITVQVDRNRFLQIMANLLSNAAKFSPEGGTVTVRVGANDTHAFISVSDSGPGIPYAFKSRIFEKFAQGDNSAARTRGGTGLGLSITKSLVEILGGAISFDTTEGEGTTFTITVPLASS